MKEIYRNKIVDFFVFIFECSVNFFPQMRLGLALENEYRFDFIFLYVSQIHGHVYPLILV